MSCPSRAILSEQPVFRYADWWEDFARAESLPAKSKHMQSTHTVRKQLDPEFRANHRYRWRRVFAESPICSPYLALASRPPPAPGTVESSIYANQFRITPVRTRWQNRSMANIRSAHSWHSDTCCAISARVGFSFNRPCLIVFKIVNRNVSQVGRPFPYMLRSSSCADYRNLGTGASVFDWASSDVSIELRT